MMLKNKKQFNIPKLNSNSFNKSVKILFDRLGNLFTIGDQASANQQELNTTLESAISTVEGESTRLQVITDVLHNTSKSILYSIYNVTDSPGSFLDKDITLYDGQAVASGHDPVLGNVISLPANFSKSRCKGPFGNILASINVSKTSGYHPALGYNIERAIDTNTNTIWYEAAIGSMPIANIPTWAYHQNRWRQVLEPYIGQGDPLSLKYTCPVCGLTYDPETGYTVSGRNIIPAGTLWQDVPALLLERYPNLVPQVCPQCHMQGTTTYLDQFVPFDYSMIYLIGPCMQVDISFDIETVFNQIAISPFSIYPMRITDIRVVDMNGRTESIIKKDIPWIEIDGPEVISVGEYYDRDEVYAKKVEIVLNQPHYTYGMSDSTRAQQQLDKLLSLLVTSDDLKRFTAPMAFEDIRNLHDKEELFQELAESIIIESTNFSNEPGENLILAAERILGEYMDGSTIDSRFQYEYLYGFKEIDLRYVEYTRQARFVSQPIHIKQSPIAIKLDLDTIQSHNHSVTAYITPRNKTGSGYMKQIVLGEPLYIKRISIDADVTDTVDSDIISADIYNIDTTVHKVVAKNTDTVKLKSPPFMDWYTINTRHHGQFEPNSGIITEVPIIGHEEEDEERNGVWSGTNTIGETADTVLISQTINVYLDVHPITSQIINKMQVRPFHVFSSNGDFNIQQYRVFSDTTSNLDIVMGHASNNIELNLCGFENGNDIGGNDEFEGFAWWESTDGSCTMQYEYDWGYFTHTNALEYIQYWYMVAGVVWKDIDPASSTYEHLSATQTGSFTQEVITDAVWIKAPVLPRGYDGPALNSTITYRSPHPVSVNITLDSGTIIRQSRTRGSIITSSQVQKGGIDNSDEVQLITELLALRDRQSYSLEEWHMVNLTADPDTFQDGIQTRYISGDKNWDPGKPVVIFFDCGFPVNIDPDDGITLSPEGSVWLLQQWIDNYTDGSLSVEDIYDNSYITNAILRTVYFSSVNLEEDPVNNPSGDPSGTKRYEIDHAAGSITINPTWARHYGIEGSTNVLAIYWHTPDVELSTEGSQVAVAEYPKGCVNKTDYYALEQPVLRPYSDDDYPVIEYLHIGDKILFAYPIEGTIEVSYQTLLPSFRIVIDLSTDETNGSSPLIRSATLHIKSSPAGIRATDINKE